MTSGPNTEEDRAYRSSWRPNPLDGLQAAIIKLPRCAWWKLPFELLRIASDTQGFKHQKVRLQTICEMRPWIAHLWLHHSSERELKFYTWSGGIFSLEETIRKTSGPLLFVNITQEYFATPF